MSQESSLFSVFKNEIIKFIKKYEMYCYFFFKINFTNTNTIQNKQYTTLTLSSTIFNRTQSYLLSLVLWKMMMLVQNVRLAERYWFLNEVPAEKYAYITQPLSPTAEMWIVGESGDGFLTKNKMTNSRYQG